jgi:hypothetical protein
MRNYWLKIILGALGIFVVGMIGVTLARSGIAKVNSVVEGEGPITIPLGLIPFVLAGERLGNLDHVTLHRESPNHVSEVELEIELTDSLLAQGLSGCRLAALFEGDSAEPGVNIRMQEDHAGAFHCVPGDSTPADLTEYGVAVFQPGDIEVPLLLPMEVVAELQSLDFGDDSAGLASGDSLEISGPDTDSIEASVARQMEQAESIRSTARSTARRFADSIRTEARNRLAEAANPE